MSSESAQVEDPNEPEAIFRDLPEQERAEFLRQYREAVDAAHDPVGYRQLQRLLHAWRLTVIATSRVGYYEEIAAVRNGAAQTRPAEEIVPGGPERLAAARAREVAREAIREYVEQHSREDLLERVLDEEILRYAEALRRLGE